MLRACTANSLEAIISAKSSIDSGADGDCRSVLHLNLNGNWGKNWSDTVD